MISTKLLGSKEINIYACDDTMCLAENGLEKTTYREIMEKIQAPYITIKLGEPKTKYFKNRMEISLDESWNGSCRLEVE